MKTAIALLSLIIGSVAYSQKQEFSDLWPNGKKRSEGVYVRGFEEGEWKFYHESGVIKEISNYRRGKMDGRVRQYNFNGQLIAEGYFSAGLQDSSYNEYSETGSLLVKGKYRKGEKIGEWLALHANGDTAVVEFFSEGKRKLIFYSPKQGQVTLRN